MRIGKARKLEFFASTFYGFFFGFSLGVGCSLAVLYAIYSGGYRKALEDTVRETKSERYIALLSRARQRVAERDAAKRSRLTD